MNCMLAYLRIPFQLAMVGVGIGQVVIVAEGTKGWVARRYHASWWLVVGEEVVELVDPAQHSR